MGDGECNWRHVIDNYIVASSFVTIQIKSSLLNTKSRKLQNCMLFLSCGKQDFKFALYNFYTIEFKKLSKSVATMATLKISSIMLIFVIISTSKGHHRKPKSYQDRMRYQMCHNRLKYHHVYHVNYQSDVKKCFVAGKKELTWEEAKSACSQLPRIRGFGRPTLARIDLNYDQYTNLIKDMSLDSCTTYYSHWTGAHIPAEYAKNNYSKWNEQWRWISDNSPLRNDYHAWALKNNQPAKKPHGFCAYYDCWDVRGMYNAPCDQKHRMLCQYKVKEPYDIHHSEECIWPKAHPNSYMHAPLTQLRFRDGTVVAVVRCDPGHVIKNDPEKRTYQTVICEHGQWPNTAMTCVKDDK